MCTLLYRSGRPAKEVLPYIGVGDDEYRCRARLHWRRPESFGSSGLGWSRNVTVTWRGGATSEHVRIDRDFGRIRNTSGTVSRQTASYPVLNRPFVKSRRAQRNSKSGNQSSALLLAISVQFLFAESNRPVLQYELLVLSPLYNRRRPRFLGGVSGNFAYSFRVSICQAYI